MSFDSLPSLATVLLTTADHWLFGGSRGEYLCDVKTNTLMGHCINKQWVYGEIRAEASHRSDSVTITQ